jgi:hypothetical protein
VPDGQVVKHLLWYKIYDDKQLVHQVVDPLHVKQLELQDKQLLVA